MSNENPNNTPPWRNKLDELEQVSGSTFNREGAWDKLHGRLRGNRKSKKIFWYWIAAACLLFGLVITILNYQKTIPQPIDKETVKEQPKETNNPVPKIDQPGSNKDESTADIKNKIVSASNKSIQKRRRMIQTEAVTKVHSDDPVINGPEKEPTAKAFQIANKNSTTVTFLPKKKLNVVHINELGDPVIEPSDITRIGDMHSFQLKFGNGEVLSNSPGASKSSGLIILKTKPASN
jgi:hypothetical protein